MGIIKNKFLTLLILFVPIILCTSCAGESAQEKTSTAPPTATATGASASEEPSPPEEPPAKELPPSSDQSQFLWGINVRGGKTFENLSSIQEDIQYGGTVEEIPYEKAPKDGHLFLLIEMLIEKQAAGTDAFKWNNLYIMDEQGNKFYRHSNDTFLEDHNFKRIKSSDLTIGKNEGFVCFEISKQSAGEQLFLVHEAPEGENKTLLDLKGE